MDIQERIDLMKLDNISEGLIIKNYKELCQLLELEPKAGNQKKAQLKDIERYFSYEKQGHKMIVKELYNVPLPPNNNITQYIPLIERLILHHMVVEDDFYEGRLYIPKSKLFKLLKMINKQYSEFKYHQMQLAHKTKIPKETIVDFYRTSDDLLERNIERALNSLASQSLIQWNHVFTVVEQDKIDIKDIKLINETIEDKYGDTTDVAYGMTYYLMKKHREATEEETKTILRLQHNLLEEYKIKTIQEVLKFGLASNFYKEVRARLFKETGLVTYYKSYEMIFNMDHIENKYNSVDKFVLDDVTEMKLFLELNEQIGNTINNNSENRHNKAVNGLGSSKLLTTRNNENYINDTKLLVNRLIKLSEKEVKS